MTLLFVLLFVWPLLHVPIAWSFSAVIMGVGLAYYGVREPLVIRCALILFVIELIYGMDLGVLSLAYLLTVLLLIGCSRRAVFTPLARLQGWPWSAIVRSGAIATGLAICMSVCSVLVGRVFYHYDTIGLRLMSQYNTLSSVVQVVVVVFVLLIVSRRLEVPFRRQVTFGT